MRRLLAVVPLVAGLLALIPGVAQAAATCHGQRATIVKSSSVIIGSNHRDVIVAGRGNDRIFAKGGNDLICAGSGNDVVDGQHGRRDVIYGGSGSDLCVAPRKAEHRYHHECEVHIIAPAGGGHPHHGAQSAESDVPALPEGSTAQGACGGQGGFCDAGVPTCVVGAPPSGNGVIGWQPGGVPLAAVPANGKVAVASQIDYFGADGQLHFSYESQVSTYGPVTSSGAYEVPPVPRSVTAAPKNSWVVWMWFDLYDPAQGWSGWYYDKADQYNNGRDPYTGEVLGGTGICET